MTRRGDTGTTVVTIHESGDRARFFAEALAAEGVRCGRVSAEGKHIYREMINLVEKRAEHLGGRVSVDAPGEQAVEAV